MFYDFSSSLLSCIIQCYMFIQDLAARNILMDQNELCKVGDFGLLRKTTKDEGQNYSYMMQVRKITVASYIEVAANCIAIS